MSKQDANNSTKKMLQVMQQKAKQADFLPQSASFMSSMDNSNAPLMEPPKQLADLLALCLNNKDKKPFPQ